MAEIKDTGTDEGAKELTLVGDKYSQFQTNFYRAWDLMTVVRKYLTEFDTGEHHSIIAVVNIAEENLAEMAAIMDRGEIEDNLNKR